MKTKNKTLEFLKELLISNIDEAFDYVKKVINLTIKSLSLEKEVRIFTHKKEVRIFYKSNFMMELDLLSDSISEELEYCVESLKKLQKLSKEGIVFQIDCDKIVASIDGIDYWGDTIMYLLHSLYYMLFLRKDFSLEDNLYDELMLEVV